MENEKMGQFICELRKSKQMTQKELADKLNITDKAVSKWERGLSCPDISLLSSLADILGVTTGDLLNGKKSDNVSEEVKESIDNALRYADKTTKLNMKSFQNIFFISFSALLFIGIVVCSICDLAITGKFTWSLYPISAIIFTWLTFFPVIKFGLKGILGSLISLTVLTIPFIYVLNEIIKVSNLILPIGIIMSVIAIIALWIIFFIFKILNKRKLMAGAISLLTVIPFEILINIVLAKILTEPIVDVWDILVFAIVIIGSVILFYFDFKSHKNKE